MPNRTRQLAENAIMLGISAVLLLLATYTILGPIVFMIVPIPFILLARQRTVRDMIFIVVTYGLLSLIITGFAGVLPAIMLALMGAVMGYLYQRTKTAFPAIMGGAGIWIMSLIVSLVMTIYVMGVDLIGEMNKITEELLNGKQTFLPPGMTEEKFKEQFIQYTKMLRSLFPAMIIMSSIIMSGFNHWLSRVISKRLGYPIPALKPFREWSFPRSLIYYYFLTLVLLLFVYQSVAESFWGSAILNLKYLLDVIFTVQGLSFCVYWFYLKGWKKITPLLIVSLFIFPPLTNILSLLGIFDLGIGLRKRLERRM